MTDPEFKLELYKSYVATITATESRRQQASTVYLGMIAAVATLAPSISNSSLIFPAATIFVVSVVWWRSVKYFRKLAKAKFTVVSSLEKKFPFAPFDVEWKAFKADGSNRLSLTHLEMALPIAAATLSGSYVLFYLLTFLKGKFF